jgi:membrane protein insertase Oxa1/YidC/SpoIIIJ
MIPQTTLESPMSEPARIGGVFLEPTKAFDDIVARPGRWWVPIILVVLAALAFTYCYSQRVGWSRMMQQQMETNKQLQNLPPEQREQAMERGSKVAGVMAYIGPVVGIPVVAVIVAGVLMLVMTSLMGAQVTFKQSLAIVAYSFLTGLVTTILSIIVMYVKSPEDFDIRNPLAFNGGAFLGTGSPSWLVALASSFDLFSFWTMALMAVGYAATTRKLNWSKAFTGVIIAWLVWVVVKVGWAAMRG